MSMDTVAYTRSAYKALPRTSVSRGLRHLLLLLASHQNPDTGWAWPSYDRLADEMGVTRCYVIRLIKQAETLGLLEVRRGHGRGHVNFYRVRRSEKVNPEARKGIQASPEKVYRAIPKRTHESEKERAPAAPVAHAPDDKPERHHRFWCEDCGVVIPTCTHRVMYGDRSEKVHS